MTQSRALNGIGLALSFLFFGLLIACGGPQSGDCSNDNECKGERICQNGTCQDPNGGNNGGNGGSNGGNGGSNGGNGGSSQGGPCSTNSCPKGQFCFNGICAIGCNTDNECADNQYCDTDSMRCANKTVSTCPASPCAEGQECVNGLCSAKAKEPPKTKEESGACQPSASGQDGCSKTAICIEPEENKTQCREFPPCPQDGKCPTGLAGAVCNDGLIQGKARICLVGLCKASSNCPANWKCIKQGQQVLGLCSDGSLGSPCSAKEDCSKDLSCLQAAPGTIGVCMSGGGLPPGFPQMP